MFIIFFWPILSEVVIIGKMTLFFEELCDCDNIAYYYLLVLVLILDMRHKYVIILYVYIAICNVYDRIHIGCL